MSHRRQPRGPSVAGSSMPKTPMRGSCGSKATEDSFPLKEPRIDDRIATKHQGFASQLHATFILECEARFPQKSKINRKKLERLKLAGPFITTSYRCEA